MARSRRTCAGSVSFLFAPILGCGVLIPHRLTRLKLTVLSGNDVAIDAYGRFGFRDYARVMVKDFD